MSAGPKRAPPVVVALLSALCLCPALALAFERANTRLENLRQFPLYNVVGLVTSPPDTLLLHNHQCVELALSTLSARPSGNEMLVCGLGWNAPPRGQLFRGQVYRLGTQYWTRTRSGRSGGDEHWQVPVYGVATQPPSNRAP